MICCARIKYGIPNKNAKLASTDGRKLKRQVQFFHCNILSLSTKAHKEADRIMEKGRPDNNNNNNQQEPAEMRRHACPGNNRPPLRQRTQATRAGSTVQKAAQLMTETVDTSSHEQSIGPHHAWYTMPFHSSNKQTRISRIKLHLW